MNSAAYCIINLLNSLVQSAMGGGKKTASNIAEQNSQLQAILKCYKLLGAYDIEG